MTTNFFKVSAKHARGTLVRLGTSFIFYSRGLDLLRPEEKTRTGNGSFPFAVLLYHRVSRDGDPLFPSLPVTAFEVQMHYLAKRFHVVSLTAILEQLRSGRPIKPWTVAITFDDGYRDNYLYAHPILKKYGLRAALFVPTAYVESGKVLWNDRMAWAIKHTKRKRIAFKSASGSRLLALESMEDKKEALNFILEELKAYPELEKEPVLEALIEELQNGKWGPEPCTLSWAELRKMAQEGWEMGSHTVNHSILTRVPEAEARGEILASKQILERELQRPVRLFAYPNGKESDFSPNIKALVRAAGYEGAVTTLDGFNPAPDPFEIRRRNAWDEHLPSFALKMRWSYWNAMRDSTDSGW